MKTQQEIFNKVVKHLLKQNEQSIDTCRGVCAYRSKDGLKCAVGCLIKTEFYNPVLEGNSSRDLWVQEALEKSGIKGHVELLQDLQDLHDNHEPPSWPTQLRELAKERGLEYEEGL